MLSTNHTVADNDRIIDGKYRVIKAFGGLKDRDRRFVGHCQSILDGTQVAVKLVADDLNDDDLRDEFAMEVANNLAMTASENVVLMISHQTAYHRMPPFTLGDGQTLWRYQYMVLPYENESLLELLLAELANGR